MILCWKFLQAESSGRQTDRIDLKTNSLILDDIDLANMSVSYTASKETKAALCYVTAGEN